MKLADQKIKQFLEELASKKPAPGGGSASALAGVMAAALVNKVAALTISKEKYKEVEEEFKRLNRETLKLQEELTKLVDADTEAFMAVMSTKGSQQAIKMAAEVPLETAAKSLAVLKAAVYASEHGNQNLRSDAFCAIELATAAVYGALENVRVNLPFIKDGRFIEKLQDEIEEVLKGTERLVKP